jgi:hypothetical protein
MARALQTAGYIPPGRVRLRCGDPKLDITPWLGTDAPRLEAGFGGWTVTGRPREVGMTTWDGVEPFQLSLPIMFDGWVAGLSQETDIANLIAVSRGDRESPPGIVTVEGLPLPVDSWVIENLDFGDPIYALDGNRLRQPVTVTLREFVPPEYLRRYQTAASKASTKTVVIRAKRGDTPAKIAKRRKVKWTDLRTLNKALIKKANQVLKEGARIRVPKANK